MNMSNVISTVQQVDVCKSKNTFFCITTTVRDVLAAYPNTIILPSSSKYNENSQVLGYIIPLETKVHMRW